MTSSIAFVLDEALGLLDDHLGDLPWMVNCVQQHERRIMSFQAYIDNIKTKTGKTPEDFRELAEKKGLLKPGVKQVKLSLG
jgi:hypothetical protein